MHGRYSQSTSLWFSYLTHYTPAGCPPGDVQASKQTLRATRKIEGRPNKPIMIGAAVFAAGGSADNQAQEGKKRLVKNVRSTFISVASVYTNKNLRVVGGTTLFYFCFIVIYIYIYSYRI